MAPTVAPASPAASPAPPAVDPAQPVSVPPQEPARLGKASEQKFDVDAFRHLSSCATVHDGTQLCLPTKRGTFLASLLASVFMIAGLLAFGLSEPGFPQVPQQLWMILLLRVVGWFLLFYIPMPVIAACLLQKYAVWGCHPAESLTKAYPATAKSIRLRAVFVFPLAHLICGLLTAFIICVPVHGEDRMGLVLILFLTLVGSMLALGPAFRCLGPPPLAFSYVRGVGAFLAFFPMLGAAAVVSVYIPLRQLGGAAISLLMPLLLSTYELLGTFLIMRNFVNKFVTQMHVRERYSETNQGICVSMGICNLHAMAEGARLTLLYAESLHNDDWTIMIPVIGGVVWNVSMRIGCFDRVLHFVTCGRWKPNNGTKYLRESGYCMGYARFGAFIAVLLSRLSVGLSRPSAMEVRPLLLALSAEITEDLTAYCLWRANVDLYPESRFATDQEVDHISLRLQRRSSTVVPSSVLPSAETTAPAPRAATEPATKEEPPHSLRWKVRAAHDFKYGPNAFGKLPLWAHFLPAVLAQFQTILAMTIVSNGLVYMLHLCQEPTGHFNSYGVFWWPLPAANGTNGCPCTEIVGS